MMIEKILYRQIRGNKNCAFLTVDKHDRLDIYEAFERWEDPVTMSIKIGYKIKTVNCNPDYDW